MRKDTIALIVTAVGAPLILWWTVPNSQPKKFTPKPNVGGASLAELNGNDGLKATIRKRYEDLGFEVIGVQMRAELEMPENGGRRYSGFVVYVTDGQNMKADCKGQFVASKTARVSLPISAIMWNCYDGVPFE